jgi:LysM repeat protein
VRGRPPGAGEGPPACPFVAFAEEPDSRAGVPDHRHRCYAQEPPEPRARAHQERFCLSAGFASCAYFQDWAVRQAAARVAEPVPVAASRESRGRARPDRAGRYAAGAGQLAAFDAIDPRFPSEEADEWDAAPQRATERQYSGAERQYSAAVPQRAERQYSAPERQYPGTERAPGAADRPYPSKERSDARSRSGNGGSAANGEERYSGYPTAARLLGIGSSPAFLPGGEELAEPGKWQRSERLQSWLEDAEQGSRAPRTQRAETEEMDAWSETFDAVDVDNEANRVAVVEDSAELQAGVLPYRASQARRTPMPAPQRIGRQAARRGMPWDRRASPEIFPELRRQRETTRRVPPVLLAALALLLAAGVVFTLPGLLSSPQRPAAAPPTSAPTDTPLPTASASAVAAATPQVYTVAKGDTLGGIARSFKLTVAELLAANPAVTDPSRIRVGQQLTIPSLQPAPTTASGG